MSNSTTEKGNGCEGIQDLIPWYPTSVLAPEERQRVEEHLAGCPACADLLAFSADLKDLLREKHSRHPEPNLLVGFVEDRAGLAPEQRTFVEDHLCVCAECREQVEILQEVEAGLADEDALAPARGRPVTASPGIRARLRAFWESVTAGPLQPVPAAVYLAAALIAIGLHLFPTGEGSDRDAAIDSDLRLGPGGLAGVVILPDETSRVRGSLGAPVEATQVSGDQRQFLLLELTNLDTPPAPDDIFTVVVLSDPAGQAALTEQIAGRAFLANYTICLELAGGALAPGDYLVRVTDPAGETVYRSLLAIH